MYDVPVKKLRGPFLIGLIVVNAMVLLGQLWPEGAPPFAHRVNVAFLIVTLVVFVASLRRKL